LRLDILRLYQIVKLFGRHVISTIFLTISLFGGHIFTIGLTQMHQNILIHVEQLMGPLLF
jgi:hypothetical protein